MSRFFDSRFRTVPGVFAAVGLYLARVADRKHLSGGDFRPGIRRSGFLADE